MKFEYPLGRALARLSVAVAFILVLQGPALAQDVDPDEFVRVHGDQFTIGSDVTVHGNEMLRGSIINIGGSVRIDGLVNGDVVVIGGKIAISGEVGGEVVAILSDINLEDDSSLRRGLINILGDLEDAGANVRGQMFNLDLGMRLPGIGAPISALFFLFFWYRLFKLVLVFIGILILAALVPERVERISEEIPRRPVFSFFTGFIFCVLGVPVITILLVASLVGIPMLPFAILIWIVLKWLGLAGVFRFIGYRFGRMLGRDMSLLGSMLLGFLFCGLISIIPIVGWIFWVLITWLGVGLLLTTRMGSVPLRPAAVPAPPPAPPATPSIDEVEPEIVEPEILEPEDRDDS